jgi:hypothetical protein
VLLAPGREQQGNIMPITTEVLNPAVENMKHHADTATSAMHGTDCPA